MVAILEKSEHNVDFHAIVDFVEASPLRRNLKLQDEEGISSLPDTELFENLTLMGYNISPNQKFTFQKGQFSHQWKCLIHTIMQCLSPKSIGFNEFSSNIATALVCLATNRTYNFSKMIFDGLVKNVNNKGKGSGTPTEPHHTPSPETLLTLHTTYSSPTLPPSSALLLVVDEPASPLRDVSQGEACLTYSGFIADLDKANIPKSSPLPHDPAPRVTSPATVEGSMQHTIDELMALCTSLQRQHSEMITKLEAQEVEINRNLDEGEAAAERVSDDSKEMATVLTSMDAVTILAGGVAEVPTGSGSIPTASSPATGVATGSDVVPTASPIFATAKESTQYTRRKGKETMIEAKTSKNKKSNETIAKYLQEYRQFALELPLERRIELTSDLIKYQDNYAKIYKYQSKQRKPLTKKQQREFYTAVLRNQAGWKAKHFKGMTLEKIKENFDPESTKKLKTSEEVLKEVKSPDEVPKAKVKEMMQLVPIEKVYVEALQVKHPIIDWKVHTEGKRSYWKITRLGGSLATKDKEIFMLVEKDYPLRKGLAIVRISYKLHVENYSRMENDLILKIFKIASTPRQQVIEFPLVEEVPTASEEIPTARRKEMPLPRGLHY
nr:hypothetical protein [Tanacetum cinerariifolium]